REALQRSGIDVDVRQVDRRDSYVQALDARRPDVVLADHSVSTFRGIDALHLARERYPDVPFIFVSGAYGEQRVIESMKEGATDYVLKDHLVRLGPAVRRALDEAAHRRNQEQAEHRLRLRANGLPALISYIDPEWRYQFANEAYRHWFGYAPEELRGKRIWDVMGRAAFDALRP